jgi:succinyl-CoA synthetase alpha subunit
MSILINGSSRVVVQGATGRVAGTHIRLMREFGTQIVAGVAPGKGGTMQDNLSIFDTLSEARTATDANVSLLMVPAGAVRDAVFEAIDAEMPLAVCVTEGVPVHDMLMVFERLRNAKTRLIGPNCPGLVSPGQSLVGVMSKMLTMPGEVGLASKSGTLSYEVSYEIVMAGLGQSSWVGLGGDALKGTSFSDVLPLFAADPATRVVVLLGEIGGTDEERAAELVAAGYPKPVVALIAGESAPSGQTMGHAGAIIRGNQGTYSSKVEALRHAGITVARSPHEVALLCRDALMTGFDRGGKAEKNKHAQGKSLNRETT